MEAFCFLSTNLISEPSAWQKMNAKRLAHGCSETKQTLCVNGCVGPSKSRAVAQTLVEKPPESRVHRSASSQGSIIGNLGGPDCLLFVCHLRTEKNALIGEEKKKMKRERVQASIFLSCFLLCQVLCNICFCCSFLFSTFYFCFTLSLWGF